MTKLELLHALRRLKGNPEIGFKVLHADGSSEFWGFEADHFEWWSSGRGLALSVVRQEKALSDEDFKKLKVKSVESADCSIVSISKRLEDRYSMPEWDVENKEELPSRTEMLRACMYFMLDDLGNLVRLKDDFIEAVRSVLPEFEIYRGADISEHLDLQK